MDTETLTLLSEISEHLSSKELSCMVFLCADDIPAAETEKIENPLHLFTSLEKKGKIMNTDLSYLKELIYTIPRIDILKNHLKTDGTDMEKYLTTNIPHISKYRCLLYKLACSVASSDVQKIKFVFGQKDSSSNSNMMELFSHLEKSGKLAQDNLSCLKKVLDLIRRKDLLPHVKEFEKQYQESNIENASEINTTELKNASEINTPQQEASKTFEVYELKCNPHGWCLIINNCNYSKTSSLKDRMGSDRDADEIKKVFTSRGYTTKKHDDLTAEGMLDIMKQYADKNHDNKDSFVCFILSHGGFGVIHGTDGNKMPISQLIGCFNNQNCKSLIGKPKIFFVQACRGEDLQRPVYEADASASEYEFDSGTGSLPAHSDIFTAYATVEDYASLRDTKSGSIYIQELCAALNNPQLHHTELQTILPMVHKKISDNDFYLKQLVDGMQQRVHCKQMPSFQSELRKSLILPAPSQITQPRD